MKLAPSLHRIGSDLVAAYLVEDRSGITPIDAGLPGHWEDLIEELAFMGHSVRDIRGVVLTHGDTDQLGFAERLRREHGVCILVHGLDFGRATGEESQARAGWGPAKVGPLLRFAWYAGRRGGLRVPRVSKVKTITDGATLDLPGNPRIIHVPGHSPGRVAVHVAAVDALFVGDALTTRHVLTGVSRPQPAPFTLDPVTAVGSLDKPETVDAAWVLPGHGPPWTNGVREVLGEVRDAASDLGNDLAGDPATARTTSRT
jgi:glyoxylase-like metal-dependent hydrolase (beta-lactamase superfamily II)